MYVWLHMKFYMRWYQGMNITQEKYIEIMKPYHHITYIQQTQA